MHVPAAVAPLPSSSRDDRRLRVPRCAHTRLTKPECHCWACLLEQIAAHATVAAPGLATGGGGPARAGVIL